MNRHDFLLTDNIEVQKLDCFIVTLFSEIEYINNNEVDENTREAITNNTTNILATIDFSKIQWLELENKSTYKVMTEYAHEVLKMYKCVFTDKKCYDYFDEAFFELVRHY